MSSITPFNSSGIVTPMKHLTIIFYYGKAKILINSIRVYGDKVAETRVRAADIVGKTIVSEETGRKFGVVANIDFITESGELLNVIVEQPTKHLSDLNLKADDRGRLLVPFSAVRSIGDFVIVSENELV